MIILFRRCILAFFTSFLLCSPAFSNGNILTTARTQVSLISEVKTIKAGEKFWVALHIQLQPGWHTYWVNPGDSGITPQLKWTLPNGFMAGPTQYLAPDREQVGPLVDYAYNNDAYYLVAVVPPAVMRDGTTTILALKASWLVCKDICVPESGDLSLALPAAAKAEPSDEAALMADLVGKLPLPVSTSVTFHKIDKEIRFDVPLQSLDVLSDEVKTAAYFPESDGLITNAAEQKVHVNADTVSLSVQQAEGKITDNASGVVSLLMKNGARKDYALRLQSETAAAQVAQVENTPTLVSPPHQGESITALLAIWYALIGGLILNAMPCVFPVLSLKALAVAKKAQSHPTDARRHGIAYTIGVVASFLLLALILVLVKKSGQAVGWGYQMQSPTFVSLLALLLFTVGLNLAGYFELPVLLGNTGQDAASKDNVRGSFLTGVLAVVVATPCTAPFMAPSIGFALTQNVGTIFAVFIALGLGLASPFLLISFFPRLIRALPKPGSWMITFKEFLAFPMFGWTIWLVWVLAREAGSEAAAVTLFSMVLFAFAFWLNRRDSIAARVLAGLAVLAALMGAVFSAHMPMPQAMLSANHAEADAFSPARLEALRKQGKAVFVDATADWCLICKVNENVALSSPNVMRAFKEKHVIYLVADWTYGDGDITRYLESFGRSGVPIYVYYGPKGAAPVVLPQVLTPATVLEVLQ